MASRLSRLLTILRTYHAEDLDALRSGRLPMGSTEKGFWGATNLLHLYDFLVKVGAHRSRSFCDLGSGDGRVAAVAALFTCACGIEWDAQLHERALALHRRLASTASLVRGDFLAEDLSAHDLLFSYPDQEFTEAFERKLMSECKGGRLFVYGTVYRPRTLARERTVWVDQTPFAVYRL